MSKNKPNQLSKHDQNLMNQFNNGEITMQQLEDRSTYKLKDGYWTARKERS